MPLGNGRLGAMVFGGTAEERVQVNESTLWGGSLRLGAGACEMVIGGAVNRGRKHLLTPAVAGKRAGFAQ